MSEGNSHFVTAADYLDYRSDFSNAADWKLVKIFKTIQLTFWNFGSHFTNWECPNCELRDEMTYAID